MKMTGPMIEQWERVRGRGRADFIWRYGVVLWGIPVAVLWAAVRACLDGWEQFVLLLPIALALFPAIGGCIVGRMWWNRNEKAYAAARQATA